MAAITSEDLARSIRIYETLFQATAVRGDAQCDRVLYSRLTRAIFTGIALSGPRACLIDPIYPPKR